MNELDLRQEALADVSRAIKNLGVLAGLINRPEMTEPYDIWIVTMNARDEIEAAHDKLKEVGLSALDE